MIQDNSAQESLTTLLALSQAINAGADVEMDDLVVRGAELAVHLLACDLCVILLLNQSAGTLVVRGSYPRLNRRALPQQAFALEPGSREALMREEGGSDFDPLHDHFYKALFSAPLMVGQELLGLMHCYTHQEVQATAQQQTILHLVANMLAVGIKYRLLGDLLAQKQQVNDFLEALFSQTYEEFPLRQQASVLGFDLFQPHVVALMDLAPAQQKVTVSTRTHSEQATEQSREPEEEVIPWQRIRSHIQREVNQHFPGSLLGEQEQSLTGLLSLERGEAAAQLASWLGGLVERISRQYQVRLSIGVSNPCQLLRDYRRGMLEASEALQMGQNLKQGGGVTAFSDLGAYRYLYKIARMEEVADDQYQKDVIRLVEYDRRKGGDLLDTLETFLECAGNLTETSRKLDIHRNTLIQRLERMQALCETDLQERANWLALQLALKVYRLRS